MTAAGEKLLVDRLPDSLLVSMGESDEQAPEVAAGRLPQGEYFLLREIFQEVFTMRRFRPDKLNSFGWQLLFALAALRKARSMPALKTVYITEEIPGIWVLLALRALKPGVRKVMLIHNVSSRRRKLPFQLFGLERDLDAICCLSQTSRQYLVDQYGFPDRKITVLGWRVDGQFFRPQPEQPSAPAAPSPAAAAPPPIVCAAGVVNRDYETLIEACSALDVDLKIAADTPWKFSTAEGANQGAASAASRNGRVEMRSWGSYTNLRDLYQRSAVVVVPLKDVEFASGQTVILEAMAMGKAVITSEIRGRSDFIEHGVNGIYVKPGDVSGLRAAISDLLQHPDKAAALGERAAAVVRERFTVVQCVNRVLRACLG